MYFIGFLFYALVVYSYFFIDEIYEIINQSYILARAITIGMGSLYIYPLSVSYTHLTLPTSPQPCVESGGRRML